MAKGKYEQSRKPSAAKKAANKANHKKSGGGHTAAAVAAIVLTLALAVGVGTYAYGSKLKNSRSIFPNVRVAGVEVGGMTASQAQEEVEQAIQDSYASQTLQVNLGDSTLEFDPEQSNVALDAEAAIEKAMAFGKQDGAFGAIKNYLGTRKSGYDLELETALELDTAYIHGMISQAAKAGRRDAKNSEVALGQDHQSITVTKGTPGRFLDEDGLYEAVYSAFQSGNFEPLTWDYVEIPYVEVDLSQYFEEMNAEVTDAHYDPETKTIVEGTSGLQFDLEKNQQKLADADYGETLTIAVEEVLPEKTAEILQEEMFGTMLDLRSSPYVNNANRTENLRLACLELDGLILNPGEVFSFNKTVGERTEAKGYKPATVFGGEGESTPGVGGGICQVASTIYWSTLYMDLETVMREPHMYIVDYVPAGMDATIYWDSGLDFKFKNNREHPLMMKANIDGGFVNISFWGQKENDNYVEMSNATLETFTSEDEEKVDETKPVGYRERVQYAYVGSKVEAYQKVYDGSGNLLKEKTIYSTYKSRPNIYVVGPSEEELPPEDEEQLNPDDPWAEENEDDNWVEFPWDDVEIVDPDELPTY